MNIKRFLSIFLFLSFFFFFSTPVFAQEIIVGANLATYVPPTGSECDRNVPSQYASIQAAINAANPGDTICVGPGAYHENVTINKSIQLSGSGYNKSIINGQDPGYYTVLISASDVTIEGFLIKGVGDSRYDATVNFISTISRVNVRYNYITAGRGEEALRVDGYQTNHLIQNNILEGNESLDAIVLVGDGGDRIDFVNNTFTGTISTPLAHWGAALFEVSSNNLIKGNIFNATGNIGGVVYASWSSIVTENNIHSEARYKVFGYPSGGTLNAENNWWGVTEPSRYIEGDIDYIPFALVPFSEYPILPLPTNQPPSANAGPDQTIYIGATANFDGSFSTDSDGNQDIVSYYWDFGDGNTGSGITTTHTYLNSGTYTVTLTVTDSAGASSSDSLVATVQTPAQATQTLIGIVESFNLQQGIENSLDAKLDAAMNSLNNLNSNDDVAAINSLQAFINAVQAQSGNKLTVDQANMLIQEAQEIMNHISS